MASTNDLTAQAYLAAGMQKLEALRRQFLIYLNLSEQQVQLRTKSGQNCSDPQHQSPANLSEWLE